MSGFPERGLTSGEVWETSGEVRGTSGEVWETSGEILDCCKVPVRELPEPPLLPKKSIAIHLPFVLQYASNLYCGTLVPLGSKEREMLSVLLPFVSQYASHLYCNTPPICIAVLLRKSWWLWSPGCSPSRASY